MLLLAANASLHKLQAARGVGRQLAEGREGGVGSGVQMKFLAIVDEMFSTAAAAGRT